MRWGNFIGGFLGGGNGGYGGGWGGFGGGFLGGGNGGGNWNQGFWGNTVRNNGDRNGFGGRVADVLTNIQLGQAGVVEVARTVGVVHGSGNIMRGAYNETEAYAGVTAGQASEAWVYANRARIARDESEVARERSGFERERGVHEVHDVKEDYNAWRKAGGNYSSGPGQFGPIRTPESTQQISYAQPYHGLSPTSGGASLNGQALSPADAAAMFGPGAAAGGARLPVLNMIPGAEPVTPSALPAELVRANRNVNI